MLVIWYLDGRVLEATAYSGAPKKSSALANDPATILSGSRPHKLLQGSFVVKGRADDTGESREARTFTKAVPAPPARPVRWSFISDPDHAPGQDSCREATGSEEIHKRAREGFEG